MCCIALQLEESEFTCAAAVKARKSMEVEIEDLHVQMEDISKTKQAVSKALYFSQLMRAITITGFSVTSNISASWALRLWLSVICTVVDESSHCLWQRDG